MTTVTHIRNLLFLWRKNRRENVGKDINVDYLLRFLRNHYEVRNPTVRETYFKHCKGIQQRYREKTTCRL